MTNLPPEHVKPGDLWAEIMSAPRSHRVRPYPASPEQIAANPKLADLEVAITPLTQQEVMICQIQAENFVKKHNKGSTDPELLKLAKSVEILQAAFKKADNVKQPFFSSTADIRKTLTPGIISTLLNMYCVVQVELEPMIYEMTEAEQEAWLDRLTRDGESYNQLSFLSYTALISLFKFLAKKALENSAPANTSVGLPLEESTEEILIAQENSNDDLDIQDNS